MYWLGLAGLPIQLYAFIRARSAVQATSLRSAWRWGVFAMGLWFTTVVAAYQSSGLMDHLAYAAVVCLFAPPVAILGARRPGVAAWSGFVVLPMLVVLQWPSVSQTLTGSVNDAFELPVPVMLGCGLVLAMGLGNYFGTRLTLPVGLMAAGIAVMLRSLVQTDSTRSPDVNTAVSIASIFMTAAAAIAIRRMQTAKPSTDDGPVTDLHRLNVVWNDFQQLFGTVWAKRVMDRMNQFAQREAWPVRVELAGFVPVDSQMSEHVNISRECSDRIRWVLRRYVDPEWLDIRLVHAP